MRYWDASALAPLLVAEDRTDDARAWLRQEPGVVTWAWTRVELTSAVERRVREGVVTRRQRREVIDRLATFAEAWDEVSDILAVRMRALSLLGRHALRAADAAQLGAAMLVREHVQSPFAFVCLDARLAAAAELEGFDVLPDPTLPDAGEQLTGG